MAREIARAHDDRLEVVFEKRDGQPAERCRDEIVEVKAAGLEGHVAVGDRLVFHEPYRQLEQAHLVAHQDVVHIAEIERGAERGLQFRNRSNPAFAGQGLHMAPHEYPFDGWLAEHPWM